MMFISVENKDVSKEEILGSYALLKTTKKEPSNLSLIYIKISVNEHL